MRRKVQVGGLAFGLLAVAGWLYATPCRMAFTKLLAYAGQLKAKPAQSSLPQHINFELLLQ